MCIQIDTKYLLIASTYLERFKSCGRDVYNFRCPFCGDSQKKASKIRGYVFPHDNRLVYKCHNCGLTGNIKTIIDQVCQDELRNYYRDTFNPEKTIIVPQPEPKVKREKDIKIWLPKISDLESDHPARIYIENRKLPTNKLYHTNDFYKFVATKTNKYLGTEDKPRPIEERIVIPFFNKEGDLIGVQGRSLNQKSIRYVTCKFYDEELIFGLNTVDASRRVYVVEGPLDSLCLENSIAPAGSGLKVVYSQPWKDVVYIWDNEPYNKEILHLMEKAIKLGKTVMVWPNEIKEKDINDLVVSGKRSRWIKTTIDENCFSGNIALLKFKMWSKYG